MNTLVYDMIYYYYDITVTVNPVEKCSKFKEIIWL